MKRKRKKKGYRIWRSTTVDSAHSHGCFAALSYDLLNIYSNQKMTCPTARGHVLPPTTKLAN